MWNPQNQGREGNKQGDKQGAKAQGTQGPKAQGTQAPPQQVPVDVQGQGTAMAATARQPAMQRGTAEAPIARDRVRQLRVVPPVDVFENDDEFLLVAEMPGGTSTSLDLRFAEDTLTLRCERDVEDQGVRLVAELRPALYSRSFVVPKGVDPDGIRAELHSGVLRVHLPKSEAMKPRQIEVRAA